MHAGSGSVPGFTRPATWEDVKLLARYFEEAGVEYAIIGGYVYRGAAIPELQGQYLFSDLCTGFVRSLSLANGVATVSEAPQMTWALP